MKGSLVRIPAQDLKPGQFVRLVGTFDHCSEFAVFHPQRDDHHLYLWLENPSNGHLYECAINTRLAGFSRMQACYLRQDIPVEAWPQFGATYGEALCYRDSLGLMQDHFREIQRAPLTDELRGLLAGCSRLQVFGFGYESGKGLHDVHRNSGEPPSSRRAERPGKDGALTLFYEPRPGVPARALWICLKFESQVL